MSEWWSMQDGALLGAIFGGSVGVIGACFGAFVGYFAPRGKHRGVVIPAHISLVLIGAIALSGGIAALLLKQPYHVWYPLTLGGFILTVVLGCMLPVVMKRYAQAEMRKIDAQQIRRG